MFSDLSLLVNLVNTDTDVLVLRSPQQPQLPWGNMSLNPVQLTRHTLHL